MNATTFVSCQKAPLKAKLLNWRHWFSRKEIQRLDSSRIMLSDSDMKVLEEGCESPSEPPEWLKNAARVYCQEKGA